MPTTSHIQQRLLINIQYVIVWLSVDSWCCEAVAPSLTHPCFTHPFLANSNYRQQYTSDNQNIFFLPAILSTSTRIISARRNFCVTIFGRTNLTFLFFLFTHA